MYTFHRSVWSTSIDTDTHTVVSGSGLPSHPPTWLKVKFTCIQLHWCKWISCCGHPLLYHHRMRLLIIVIFYCFFACIPFRRCTLCLFVLSITHSIIEHHRFHWNFKKSFFHETHASDYVTPTYFSISATHSKDTCSAPELMKSDSNVRHVIVCMWFNWPRILLCWMLIQEENRS